MLIEKNNNNKNILISFYYKHKSGGFTKRLYQAYLALANAGYHIHYFSTEILPVKHTNIHPHLIRLTSQPGSARFWVGFFYHAVKQARAFKSHYGDNSHYRIKGYIAFSFFYGALASITRNNKNEKQWVFIRGDDLYGSRSKSLAPLRIAIHYLLEKISIRSAYYVICTNKSMMEAIAKRSGHREKIHYLPNNIPRYISHTAYVTKSKHRARAQNSKQWTFVTASVINPRKQQLVVLQALNQLPSNSWHYTLIGADIEHTGYEAILRDYVQKHQLTNNVEFLGWQEDIITPIRRCDLFIFPTTMEGSPNALLEALGTGIPCIGSDIPEVAEILRFPELTFSHRYPSSLQKILQAFIDDKSVRRSIAEKTALCRKNYEFDWDTRLVQFFESDALLGHRVSKA